MIKKQTDEEIRKNLNTIPKTSDILEIENNIGILGAEIAIVRKRKSRRLKVKRFNFIEQDILLGKLEIEKNVLYETSMFELNRNDEMLETPKFGNFGLLEELMALKEMLKFFRGNRKRILFCAGGVELFLSNHSINLTDLEREYLHKIIEIDSCLKVDESLENGYQKIKDFGIIN